MANRLDLPPNNSLYYSVPAPAPAPQVDPRLSMRQRLENLSAGLGYGLTGQLEDLRSLATDPVGYGQNVLRALKAVAQQPSILGNALRESARRAASGPLGAGEVAGGLLPLRPGGKVPVRRDITTYHGSPHQFEEFDASKIGTGEGAQMYGRGIYLAENPDVAKYYAGKISGKKGTTYTVDLPDEIADRMLDWDKPLNQQPAELQSLVSEFQADILSRNPTADLSQYTGKNLVGFLSRTNRLYDLPKLGVSGIRYLDEGSRVKGKGTRNFVVFPGEEKKARILKRELPLRPGGQAPVMRATWPAPSKLPTDAELVYMSPQEYLAKVAESQKTDFSKLPFPIRKPKTIEKIRKALKQGEDIDTPWIKIKNGKIVDQEGRHRATAALEEGVEQIPVFVYTK
jgi:hypothetical protein